MKEDCGGPEGVSNINSAFFIYIKAPLPSSQGGASYHIHHLHIMHAGLILSLGRPRGGGGGGGVYRVGYNITTPMIVVNRRYMKHICQVMLV